MRFLLALCLLALVVGLSAYVWADEIDGATGTCHHAVGGY